MHIGIVFFCQKGEMASFLDKINELDKNEPKQSRHRRKYHMNSFLCGIYKLRMWIREYINGY